MTKNTVISLVQAEKPVGFVSVPSDTYEVCLDISEESSGRKLLGEIAVFQTMIDGQLVLVLGQVTDIVTMNKWHEDPTLKGVIKREGEVPNLSRVADNRIAKITVQSSFIEHLDTFKPYILSNSPSTGVPALNINDKILMNLLHEHMGTMVSVGNAYGTDIRIPFTFRHFGSDTEGAGEAYHIGIYGRSGSGKTTTAANMMLGYGRHFDKMSMIILDPQGQFYNDIKVLPHNNKFENEIKQLMPDKNKYIRCKIPGELALPNDPSIFAKLLTATGMLEEISRIHTTDRLKFLEELVEEYLEVQINQNDGSFQLGDTNVNKLDGMLRYLLGTEYGEPRLEHVYMKNTHHFKNLNSRFEQLIHAKAGKMYDDWANLCEIFAATHKHDNVVADILKAGLSNPGYVIVLDISGDNDRFGRLDLELFFVKFIEDKIRKIGEELFLQNKTCNALIVMDEAHRFISNEYRRDELTESIINSIRTTRKYGIGYMYITQTLESLHKEIKRQIRINAFGYGLTSGSEFKEVMDIVNDERAAKMYKSFIDPASNKYDTVYPFMFHGPISPLSFSGAPLFLQMNPIVEDYSISTDESIGNI